MAVFKCKMCGGALEVNSGESVVVCDYCGTKQTLPKTDDGVVANLFNRANNLRLKCEFDKAEAIYEKILEQDNTEAEAHWGIILCKYGIEYVEDPKTLERIPTCHRTSYESITASAEYLAALEHADSVQREIYEHEAKEIDSIQKNILSIVKNEKPFDVFICYKETDENGKRTVDSAIANDIYYQLTQEGFKVFYAAITLEDKLGQEYEPYIFAALNSAKVMLAIGTKPEYFEAVWVKNEWSRFMNLMKTDRSKLLIPCYKDMDAYDLPEDFAHLQAQDMGKIGFINDVVRGIKKVVVKEEQKETATTSVKASVSAPATNAAPLLERAFIFLEDEEWESADEYFEKVLDLEPKNAMAYLGKLCVELEINSIEKLSDSDENLENYAYFKKAVRFADDEKKAKIDNILKIRDDRIAEEKRIEEERKARELKEKEERKAKERKAEEARRFEDERRRAEEKRRFDEQKQADFLKAKELFEKAESFNDYAAIISLILKYRGDSKIDELLSNFSGRRKTIMQKISNVFLQLFSCKEYHTVALKSDGSVVSTGRNDDGQCDVLNWKNIVAVSCGYRHTLGIKFDGTVVAIGYNEDGRCNVSSWKDIVSISCGSSHTVGLKSNGTVVATGYNGNDRCDVSGWKDIMSISCGDSHTVGLKSNGMVVATGSNEYNQCDVSGWRDITAISCGSSHMVGLKFDGTVVATGYNPDGRCNVSDWNDIVAVSCGICHTVGLKFDGTVVATGFKGGGRCDVSNWENIVAVYCGGFYTAGLKSDGTIIVTGENKRGERNVSDWKLFDNVDELIEKEEARIAAEKARREAARKAKIESLEKEKATLEAELPTIKGLFSGSKKAKIEARIAEIEKELQTLK